MSNSDAAAPPSTTTGWSLERRLPLLMLALLASVIGGLSLTVYREVRRAAIDRATDRLEAVARELAVTAARNGQPRVAALRALAADSALVGLVRRGARASVSGPDRAATVPLRRPEAATTALASRVAAVLAASAPPNDSELLGWELWTGDGAEPYRSGPPGSARDSVMLAVARAAVAKSDSVQRSALYAANGEIHAWTVVPVRAGGGTVGMLAERRRLSNSTQAEATVRQLTGEDVRVLFTSRGAPDWASLRGTPLPAPITGAVGEDRVTLAAGTRGEPLYVVQSRVPGTPWRVVLLQSQASVLRRPHEFVRTLLGVGAVFLALGTAGAWLLGRHVARPMRRVTDAAAALAGGDYDQRVPVAGAMEVASLASTFNAMAAGLGHAHAALAERNVALQRANDAKGQFLAMMSHELRTPLNAIGGYTELLELGLRGPVTPQQIGDLSRIRRNKDHLLAVITDILSFVRAEAGVLPLTLTAVPAADVLRDAVDMVGPQFQAKGVRLRVEPAPPGAVIHGDREKVQEVVLNLLANALNFTDPSGEVVLACARDAATVRLEVRDTGIGIAADRLGEIFEPFVQIDGSLTRRVGGTGLGLAIVRQLTTAMGGHLRVESTPGEGSRFVVLLPSDAAVGATGRDAGVASSVAVLAD